MRKLYMTMALAAACTLSFAQSVPALLIPVDAGAPAASTVLFNSDRAYENNAAAMVFSEHNYSAWAGLSKWAPKAIGTTIVGGGASARLGGKFAVGLSYHGYKDKAYEIINSTGSKSGSFSPNDMIISLGASYKISSAIALGVKVKQVSSSIAKDSKGSAFCADAAVFYHKEALDISAGVFNLGSKISWGGDSYALPAIVKAGAAYSISGIRAGAELEYLLSGAFGASLGAEYCYAGMVSARAAYHYGDKSSGLASYATLGLGASFMGITLDLAYLLASDTLNGGLIATLGYAF